MTLEPLAPQAPLHLVLNRSVTHADDAALTHLLAQALGASGRALHWYPVDLAHSLPAVARRAARAAAQDGGHLVAVGGDGTVSAVARQALAHGVSLGVVPRGAFTYFAREHGVPLSAPAAVRALLAPCARRVQVGRVAGHVFVVNASLGLGADLPAARHRDSTLNAGLATRSLTSGRLAVPREAPLLLSLSLGDEVRPLHASRLFVGNNAQQLAPPDTPAPGRLTPGRLAALAVASAPAPAPGGAARRLKGLLQTLRNPLSTAGRVMGFGVQRMTVRNSHCRSMQLVTDGDVHTVCGPLDFHVDRASLRLVGWPPGGLAA